MNYLKQYIKLIKKAEKRDPIMLKEIYVERHHVFPIGMYGDNNRLVTLTFKEHLIAHHLAYKAAVKRYGNHHNKTIKAQHALHAMLYYKRKSSLSDIHIAKMINKLKNKSTWIVTEEVREKIREATTGEKNGMYGKNHTSESIKKMSETKKGQAAGSKNPNYKGNKHNWINKKLKKIEINLTVLELEAKYSGLLRSGLYRVSYNQQKIHKGWELLEDGNG